MFKKSSSLKVICLFIGLIISYAVVCFYVFPKLYFDEWDVVHFFSSSETILDSEGIEHEVSKPSSLFVSFAASALQDILFFLVTGIVLLIFSIKRPENDNLAKKLTYLFPDAKNDTVLKDYLEHSVTKLGCIADKSSFVVTLLAYDDMLKAFKVQVHYESHLRNLHNKDYFSDPQLAMKLTSDLTECPPDGLFGQLVHVKVYNFTNNGISDIADQDSEYPVNMTDKSFKHSCPFSLAPHAVALFDAKHWEWSPLGKLHFLRVARFTKTVSFKCVNNTNQKVDVSYSQITSESDAQASTLSSDQVCTWNVAEVIPSDGIKLDIRLAVEKPDVLECEKSVSDGTDKAKKNGKPLVISD